MEKETNEAYMDISDQVELYESRLEETVELYHSYEERQPLTPEYMESIGEKITNGEAPEDRKEAIVMKKYLLQEKMIHLLEYMGEEEFQRYNENFQTELNSALLKLLEKQPLTREVTKLRNKFDIIEKAKERRRSI